MRIPTNPYGRTTHIIIERGPEPIPLETNDLQQPIPEEQVNQAVELWHKLSGMDYRVWRYMVRLAIEWAEGDGIVILNTSTWPGRLRTAREARTARIQQNHDADLAPPPAPRLRAGRRTE